MMRAWLATGLLCCVVGCAGVAADAGQTGGLVERDDFVACTEPRPEMCTQAYIPVCALRATTGDDCAAGETCGVRYEERTSGNRCQACTDPEVIGFIPGACGAEVDDSPIFLEP